jgi:putative transposase
MARPLRVEYPGALYHVMNRGDRRQAIFRGDADRYLFLESLQAACEKTGWQIHAYCLMPNHFHLIPETPIANLVAGMKWLLGTYTIRFNRRHQLSGHLFGGRYKAQLIDESAPHYLRIAADYVHLNPARAALIDATQKLDSYRWSSYPTYLQAPKHRPGWLRVDRVLGEHGVQGDNVRGRREFRRRIESQRQEGPMPEWNLLREGWRVGEKDFLSRLAEQFVIETAEHHSGQVRRESEIEKAQRLISEKLALVGWDRAQLPKEPKGHPMKIRIAQEMREQSTMSVKWIATELSIGSWTYLNKLLCRQRLSNT